MKVKSIKSQEEMFRFLQEIYRRGFEDGANSDVDPSIHYIAIKRNVRYICGNCEAELHLDELED